MVKRLLACIPLLVLVHAGCESSPTLTEDDLAVGARVELMGEQLLAIKGFGKNLRQLEGTTDEGESLAAPGVTIDVAPSSSLDAVRRLRRELGEGYLVFVSERNFGIGGVADEVSVLRGSDPFQTLRTMGTNGWNYDISPDAVIERIKQWDAEFGLDLHGVGFDWLEAEFVRQPADMSAFAQRVYEFCPDVVEQGTGSVEALAREMTESNLLYLWWD